MGKSIPIKIGEFEFKTKSTAENFIKNIKAKYKPNSYLDKTDFDFIFELIKLHPNANEKIGSGISSIQIRLNKMGNATAFYIIRSDKSETDFSYKKCLNGQDGLLKQFTIAAREAVSPQIIDFKKKYFSKHQNANGQITCPITRKKVNREQVHVDHDPTSFQKLVNAFIATNKIALDVIKYTGQKDGDERLSFADESFKKQFDLYHKQNAELRVISKKANLQKPRQ